MLSSTDESEGPLTAKANHQLRWFAVLGVLVLTLSIDVLGLLGVGDAKASGALELPPSTTTAWSALDPGARQLLDKELESIKSEIRLRLEQEHLLFALKFALVGSILWAFLQTAFRADKPELDRTPFGALAAWAAVIAAAIVDLRAMSNQAFLITLGGWTRQYEQLSLGANGARLGWEAFLADNLLSKSFYPALRVNSQILTALLFCVTAFVFLLRADGKNDPNTARISGIGAIVAICIMTMAALSLRPASLAMAIYMAVGLIAIVLVALMSRWSYRNHQAEPQ
jgi:hypothetical protein